MKRFDPATPLQASCQIQVPFNDLDPAGVVWHGRYFKYFESARSLLMEQIGYSYKEMHASGYLWPVVDLNVRFLKPLRLGDRMTVKASLCEWEFRLKVEHQITDEVGDVCARGTTVQVPVLKETNTFQLGSPNALVQCVETCLAKISGQATKHRA